MSSHNRTVNRNIYIHKWYCHLMNEDVNGKFRSADECIDIIETSPENVGLNDGKYTGWNLMRGQLINIIRRRGTREVKPKP